MDGRHARHSKHRFQMLSHLFIFVAKTEMAMYDNFSQTNLSLHSYPLIIGTAIYMLVEDTTSITEIKYVPPEIPEIQT